MTDSTSRARSQTLGHKICNKSLSLPCPTKKKA
jgi:hypothetical protein